MWLNVINPSFFPTFDMAALPPAPAPLEVISNLFREIANVIVNLPPAAGNGITLEAINVSWQ